MKTVIGSILIFAGIIAIAGSAGDCDGKCMENANTIGEMLMIAGIGLISFIGGAGLLVTSKQ
jgi:hypothetical protein|tara:strand:+ start:4106 stop:4291 length:186 start_codon:yes stop_codon:yes gene_type:complete